MKMLPAIADVFYKCIKQVYELDTKDKIAINCPEIFPLYSDHKLEFILDNVCNRIENRGFFCYYFIYYSIIPNITIYIFKNDFQRTEYYVDSIDVQVKERPFRFRLKGFIKRDHASSYQEGIISHRISSAKIDLHKKPETSWIYLLIAKLKYIFS